MNTNKFFLWIAASLLSTAFCAYSAMADVARPEAYQQLTAVELHPTHAPLLQGGVTGLGASERRYYEPLQLQGVIQRVKARKYVPTTQQKKRKSSRS